MLAFIERFRVKHRSRPWFKACRSIYVRLIQSRLIEKIRTRACRLFALFYVPRLYSFYLKELGKIPQDTQVFIFARFDFGPHVLMVHYARLWQEARGQTCIVIAAADVPLVKKLAESISPESILIAPETTLLRLATFIFGKLNMHYAVFAKCQAMLAADRPNAIFIHTQPSSSIYSGYCTPHIVHFDTPYLKRPSHLSADFIKAYLNGRNILDYRHDLFVDMIRLHLSSTTHSNMRDRFKEKRASLFQNLGMDGPYVVMNINAKDYHNVNANRRRIHHYEPYDLLIDELIQKGYSVVIQGRREQPLFKPRKGLVDYCRGFHCSTENDIILYSGCDFSVTSRTGGEVLTTLFDIPILGINYTDLPCVLPNTKCRFYPKQIKNLETGQFLSWRKHLNSPCFFNIQTNNFEEKIDYLEIDSSEMMEALNEFLSLLSQPDSNWNQLTPRQTAFNESLTPLHMDLYYIPGVPCDAYLARCESYA